MNTYIFDLDGTLLNTAQDLSDAFNYALSRFGYGERTVEEFVSFVGDGVKKALERATGEDVSLSKLDEITDVFKFYYKEHLFEKTLPYPGIIPMLEKLKTENNKIAVVSNKFDDAVKMLSKKYFGELIDIAIGEGYGIRRKPAPDGIYKVMNELGANRAASVYIGDSDTDIMTAKNAGIPCISVIWGFRSKDFLQKSGAEYFAQTPEDIINFNVIENML